MCLAGANQLQERSGLARHEGVTLSWVEDGGAGQCEKIQPAIERGLLPMTLERFQSRPL